jgi:probable rRNA maturation factor
MATLVARRAPKSPALSTRIVKALAERMLAALDLADAELSVLLVDDNFIQNLNREHRGKDRPTDVLAFPVDEEPIEAGPRVLGDVVISLPTAKRQAESRKRELLPEVRFLLAHGLLHLVGHDHATKSQKRKMDAAARRLVRAAPLPHPGASLSQSRRSAPARPKPKVKAPSRDRTLAGKGPARRSSRK